MNDAIQLTIKNETPSFVLTTVNETLAFIITEDNSQIDDISVTVTDYVLGPSVDIKGPTGNTGPRGLQGDIGPRGMPGADAIDDPGDFTLIFENKLI